MAGGKSSFRRSSLHVVIVLLVFYPVGLYIYTQSVNRATAEDIVIRVSDDLGREAISDVIQMEPVGIRYDVVVPEFAVVGPPATFDMLVRLVDVETGHVVTGDDRSFDIEAINSTNGTPGEGELGIGTSVLVDGVAHLQQTYSALENVFFLVSDGTGDQVFSTTVQMRATMPRKSASPGWYSPSAAAMKTSPSSKSGNPRTSASTQCIADRKPETASAAPPNLRNSSSNPSST